MKNIVLFLALIVYVSNAYSQTSDEPILNGASIEEYQKSMEVVKASLSEDEIKEFGMSLFAIIMSFKDNVPDDKQEAELLKILDGKTAKEVVEYVKEMDPATLRLSEKDSI